MNDCHSSLFHHSPLTPSAASKMTTPPSASHAASSSSHSSTSATTSTTTTTTSTNESKNTTGGRASSPISKSLLGKQPPVSRHSSATTATLYFTLLRGPPQCRRRLIAHIPIPSSKSLASPADQLPCSSAAASVPLCSASAARALKGEEGVWGRVQREEKDLVDKEEDDDPPYGHASYPSTHHPTTSSHHSKMNNNRDEEDEEDGSMIIIGRGVACDVVLDPWLVFASSRHAGLTYGSIQKKMKMKKQTVEGGGAMVPSPTAATAPEDDDDDDDDGEPPLYITDLRSTNGTFINKERLLPGVAHARRLRHGDNVIFGGMQDVEHVLDSDGLRREELVVWRVETPLGLADERRLFADDPVTADHYYKEKTTKATIARAEKTENMKEEEEEEAPPQGTVSSLSPVAYQGVDVAKDEFGLPCSEEGDEEGSFGFYEPVSLPVLPKDADLDAFASLLLRRAADAVAAAAPSSSSSSSAAVQPSAPDCSSSSFVPDDMTTTTRTATATRTMMTHPMDASQQASSYDPRPNHHGVLGVEQEEPQAERTSKKLPHTHAVEKEEEDRVRGMSGSGAGGRFSPSDSLTPLPNRPTTVLRLHHVDSSLPSLSSGLDVALEAAGFQSGSPEEKSQGIREDAVPPQTTPATVRPRPAPTATSTSTSTSTAREVQRRLLDDFRNEDLGLSSREVEASAHLLIRHHPPNDPDHPRDDDPPSPHPHPNDERDLLNEERHVASAEQMAADVDPPREPDSAEVGGEQNDEADEGLGLPISALPHLFPPLNSLADDDDEEEERDGEQQQEETAQEEVSRRYDRRHHRHNRHNRRAAAMEEQERLRSGVGRPRLPRGFRFTHVRLGWWWSDMAGVAATVGEAGVQNKAEEVSKASVPPATITTTNGRGGRRRQRKRQRSEEIKEVAVVRGIHHTTPTTTTTVPSSSPDVLLSFSPTHWFWCMRPPPSASLTAVPPLASIRCVLPVASIATLLVCPSVCGVAVELHPHVTQLPCAVPPDVLRPPITTTTTTKTTQQQQQQPTVNTSHSSVVKPGANDVNPSVYRWIVWSRGGLGAPSSSSSGAGAQAKASFSSSTLPLSPAPPPTLEEGEGERQEGAQAASSLSRRPRGNTKKPASCRARSSPVTVGGGERKSGGGVGGDANDDGNEEKRVVAAAAAAAASVETNTMNSMGKTTGSAAAQQQQRKEEEEETKQATDSRAAFGRWVSYLYRFFEREGLPEPHCVDAESFRYILTLTAE